MTVSERPVAAPSVDGPTMGLAVQFGLLLTLAAGTGLGLAGWLTGTAYAIATWLVLGHALRRSGNRALGPANQVTLARATLVGGVAALVADTTLATFGVPSAGVESGLLRGHATVVLVVLATVALTLDAVDGQVARRTGTSSSLGARFDMEIDAFLILVLSVFVALSLGWWVLAIGLLRYAFVAASWGLPWLKASLPPRFTRKVVAALQGIVLVVAGAGLLPSPLPVALVGFALAALLWSFGRDVRWLWRHDRRQASPR